MDNSSHSKSVVSALWFSGYWEWVELADFRTLTQRNQKPGCLRWVTHIKANRNRFSHHWRLAVTVRCFSLPHLIPNLLSNNDSKGFVSDETRPKKQKKGNKGGPHLGLSQRHPSSSWSLMKSRRDFILSMFFSETRQSPWFNMTHPLFAENHKLVWEWRPRVCGCVCASSILIYFCGVEIPHLTYLPWTRVSREFTGIFHTLLTGSETARNPLSRWGFVSEWTASLRRRGFGLSVWSKKCASGDSK